MEDANPARPRRARTRGRTVVALAALAAAFAPGCSQYIGTTAASYMKRVRDDPDPNVRYLAYAKLAQPRCYDSPAQKAEAVETLVSKLEKGKEPVATRAVIIHTLGALGDPAARNVVVKAVSDPEAVIRVQACRALGKVGRVEDATVLTRVMTVDTLEDCRIAAIESIGMLKPDDPRIVKVLVEGMRHDDPATRLASLNALRGITGKDYGVDPVAWQKALPADVAKSSQTLIASPAPARKPPESVYPPRPVPPPVTDPEAKTVGFPLFPAPADPRSVAPAATENYPAHNPNLPARPAR